MTHRTIALAILTLSSALLVGCGRPPGESRGSSSTPEDSIVVEPQHHSEDGGTISTTTASASGGGTITGKVLFNGDPYKQKKIDMAAKPTCAALHNSTVHVQTCVVNPENKGLQWVFVYIKSGLKGNYPAPTTPVVIDQKGCTYTPHVFGIQSGQTLNIKNSDSFEHNINVQPKKSPAFNIIQSRAGTTSRKNAFRSQELMVPFKCNIHSWMISYCGVLDHPFYAVSNADGDFTIPNVPPGNYTLGAWHEHRRLGRQQQAVTVTTGGTSEVTITYERK